MEVRVLSWAIGFIFDLNRKDLRRSVVSPFVFEEGK